MLSKWSVVPGAPILPNLRFSISMDERLMSYTGIGIDNPTEVDDPVADP